MRRAEDTSRLPRSLLCVNNGGVVTWGGRCFANRVDAAFLVELAGAIPDVRLSGWAIPPDDPLQVVELGTLPCVHACPLPHPKSWSIADIGVCVRAFLSLFRAVSTSGFVYVFAPGGVNLIAAWCARLLGRPYGIYLRGELGIDRRSWTPLFGGARFMLTTGEHLKRSVLGRCPDVATVTPMVSLFAEEGQSEHVRPAGPWRLLYVGQAVRSKGTSDLIRACELLHAAGLDFRLAVVGKVFDKAGLELEASPGALGHIDWIGAVAEPAALARFYRGADVFIFPSHDEGFPRVLYEAMSFELPIVTTFVGGIPSLMREEVNCLRVEPSEPAQIASAIVRLLNDPDLRIRLARQGHVDLMNIAQQWKSSHACQVLARLGWGSV